MNCLRYFTLLISIHCGFNFSILDEVIGLCEGGPVFVLFDSGTERKVNMQRNWNVIVASDRDFDINFYPKEQLKGSSLTAILVLSKNPQNFLNQTEGSLIWNPNTVIVIAFEEFETDSILASSSVRRSKFIYSIEMDLKKREWVLNAGAIRKPKEFIGLWTKEKEKKNVFKSFFRFLNFEGTHLQVSSFCDDFPYLFEDEEANCLGVSIDIMAMLGKNLNFTFNVTDIPPDGQWGFLENGTWNGMLAGLAYEGMDITINLLILDYDKAQAFDHTSTFTDQESFAFLIKTPDPNPQWQSLVQPFNYQMWASVLVSTFVVALFLLGLHRVLKKKDRMSVLMVRYFQEIPMN